jgi:hypothetical protein
VALNRKYAKQGLAEANVLADKAEALFKKDAELSDYFNTKLANGKWNHFADQTHIGYTYWQQPNKNAMPKVERVKSEDIKQEIKKDSTENNWVIFPPNLPKKSFLEVNKYVSMEAEHFSRAINSDKVSWKTIPDIGRTSAGVTIFPVNIPTLELSKDSPHLEYDINLSSEGVTKISVMLSPTLEFNNNVGLKYAISVDDETPQIVEIHKDRSGKEWNKIVAENIKVLTTTHAISSKGTHTLKFWAIDPAVILQKIIVDFGGVKPSYLGPPESLIVK